MSRIDFRVDRHFSTAGHFGRHSRSFDRSQIAYRCRAHSPIAPVCDRWQPSTTGSTPNRQSVKDDYTKHSVLSIACRGDFDISLHVGLVYILYKFCVENLWV